MRYFFSTLIGLALGALVGALLGYVVQLVLDQVGWALTLGSLGACLGATWAALLRAEERTIWQRLTTRSGPAGKAEDAT